MRHPDETLANIRLEKEIKYLEHTLETYLYSHFNMCNISIYFCNIKMKHLKHTLATWALLRRTEARRRGGRRRRMDLAVRQRHRQLASGRGVTQSHPPQLLAGASVVEALARWRQSR
jgi:hypothetical protein